MYVPVRGNAIRISYYLKIREHKDGDFPEWQKIIVRDAREKELLSIFDYALLYILRTVSLSGLPFSDTIISRMSDIESRLTQDEKSASGMPERFRGVSSVLGTTTDAVTFIPFASAFMNSASVNSRDLLRL
jgi:hypothetical protein